MKRVLLAASAIAAFVGTASAADMRAPVYKAMAPVAAYNWTGLYLGVNAGLGVGEHSTILNVPSSPLGTSVTGAPIGAIGGVQAGYNWQFGNWVLGVEADIQGSGQSETHCLLQCVPALSANVEQNLSWFGTVRGRVGYTIGNGILAYYTGGFAYGNAETTITEAAGGAPGTFKFSDTKTGWTLGSGVEAALGGNWTGKIEYLYIDLGSFDGSYNFAGATHFYSQEVRSHVFRGGLNYRLGGAMLAPQPLANWNGLYIGANLGSGISRHDNHLVIPAASGEQFVSAPTGFIGGAQIGYNWQSANWLLGLETDFQGTTQKDTVCVLRCAVAGGGSFSTEQTLPWFGTLRGRVGYATGPTLFYLTGGLAYGKIESDVTEFIAGTLASRTFSETKTGWTLGGGIERPFDFFGLIGGPNWSAKAEYLYVDLGSTTNTYVQGGAAHTFTTDVTNHIFRTGINYRFGGGPVIAKY
jgi:outer membrane immunogenic protein